MGFHKRHITKEFIVEVYSRTGYTGLCKLILKPDAIYLNDAFSNRIVDLIYNDKLDDNLKKEMIEGCLHI